jgi:hypothetical protein
MSFDFVTNTLQDLTSGPLGSWIIFAGKTAPNAAALAFAFVALVAILFSLLIWCAGDPKGMLPTVLLVTPIAGLYIAVVVGGIVAFCGWPIIWLFEQIFALSPDLEDRASVFVKINYLSIALVMGAAVAVVIVLLVHGIWSEERKARRQFAKGLEYGSRVMAQGEYLELVEVKDPLLHKPHEASRASEGYRRVGLALGSIFAICPIVIGLFFARTGLSISLLVYCGLAGVIMFLIPYVVSRLLGWIVDNFISKMQAGTS